MGASLRSMRFSSLMRAPDSPARAFAWELARRHRWGLIAVAGYLIALATINPLFGLGYEITLDPPNGIAPLLLVPFSAAFLYFLAVFTFGLAGDLAARQSMYPARMFTLPVTTAALAGWPMLYGMTAMFVLYLTAALFGRWSWGIVLPLIWPALLAAVFLGWTQVLTWMPYGLRGLRVIAALLWLPVLDAIIIVAFHYEVSEGVMIAFLAPQVPLSYLAARYAVARARSGNVPDWRGAIARAADVLPRRIDRLSSPSRAQAWFEWRQHGRSLPVWIGILLPFEMALLFVTKNDTPVFVTTSLVLALLSPPVMAGFAAATVSRATAHASTRPLTTVALVAAKLKMALRSTLTAWLLVVFVVPIALAMSGTWPIVLGWWRRGVEAMGMLRMTTVVLLGFAGLLASTWKQLVQNLCIGLTGREWIIKANVFLTLSFLVVLGPLVHWVIDSRRAVVALWEALPWITGVLVVIKMSIAAWIIRRLHDRRLLSDRALVIGAACWTAGVLALYGLLAALFALPLIPRYLFGLIAILEMPLARLSAAPLALAWNRHR